MAIKPWMTSDDLIASVKRKISFPVSQNTFTDQDILSFANEEMAISQVPSVLEFHEEYFVFVDEIPLVQGTSRYQIPERALGMKLRDVKYKDVNGNWFDMHRVAPEDKAFFQRNIGTSETLSKYYIEGNDVVLLPTLVITDAVSLLFYYFLRPNQLVPNGRAAIIKNFVNDITVVNSSLAAGDIVTIGDQVFTAVTSSPGANQFLIDGTDAQTATNLTNAINANGVATASNGNPATSQVTLRFSTIAASQAVSSSNSVGLVVPTDLQTIEFDQVPSTYTDPVTFAVSSLFTDGATIDFLQTRPGHRTYKFDVQIPTNGISSNFVTFVQTDVPTNMVLGDYMCLSNECIIPQIPPDLHNALAQRTCAMILSAIGDQAGMQVAAGKVQEMEKHQITLLDNRVESSPLKIAPKHSILRFQGMGSRRRRL
jgi:hypothetical protein